MTAPVSHSYVEEHDFVDRYCNSQLPAEDCIRFEEHFADCIQCQEQLETAADFKQGLRSVAAEGAAKPRVSVARPAWLSWLAGIGDWQLGLAGAAACLILVAIPTVALLRQIRLVRTELSLARVASEESKRKYEQELRARADLEGRLQAIERKSRETPVPSENLTAKLPALASIFVLNTVRDGELSGSEPVNRVVLSRSPQWVVLSLDRDEVGAKSYRAVLKDSGGQVSWKDEIVPPTYSKTLSISVPSSLFHEGDYLLTLEGLSQQGRLVISRQYPFRVKFRL